MRSSDDPITAKFKRHVAAVIKRVTHPCWREVYLTKAGFIQCVENLVVRPKGRTTDLQKDAIGQYVYCTASDACPPLHEVQCIVWKDKPTFHLRPQNAIRHAIAKVMEPGYTSAAGYPLSDEEQDAWNKDGVFVRHKGIISEEDVING